MSVVVKQTGNSARMLAMVALLSCSAGHAYSGSGWVTDRDDRGQSPLLKERKAIANSPEEQQQLKLETAYRQALRSEQEKIREHWAAPEVSGPTRWVSYDKDYEVKRVVDFESNHIEISLQGIYSGSRLDFDAMAAKVNEQLQVTLGTTLGSAVTDDPIQAELAKAYLALGVPDEQVKGAQDLVLKELFQSSRPSSAEVRQMAGTLMRNASIRYQSLNAGLATVPVNTGRKMTYVMPLPDNRLRRKVKEYRPEVSKNAQRFSVSADIVMAIIHTESHFNPLARSHIPAFGLMQIVPATAGRDATRKIYKASRLLSAQYLYNPQRNIEVGTAYLSVLYYDYLQDIRNPESRLYYTIAAYNAGASSVARAFVDKASFQDAVEVINKMTPQQVLERLLTKAPRQETRQYVEKVLKRRAFYAAL